MNARYRRSLLRQAIFTSIICIAAAISLVPWQVYADEPASSESQASNVTISFVDQDGSTFTSYTAHVGDALEIPQHPERAGYVFTGWKPAPPAQVSQSARFTATWAPVGLTEINGSYRYVDASGTPQGGWQMIDGSWYLFDSKGWALSGWQQVRGWWYLCDNTGKLATGLTQDPKGYWYYFNVPGGWMESGWKMIDGSWHYFTPGGWAVSGWQSVNGWWYLCDNTGKVSTGLTQDPKGYWYCFNSPGGWMETGWQMIDGAWYYFTSGGWAVPGWHQVNGWWYLCDDTGKLTTGHAKSPAGYWYYFNVPGGWMETGWKDVDGSPRYFASDGHRLSGMQKIDGSMYSFDDAGVPRLGLHSTPKGKVYGLERGRLATGLTKTPEGKTYYFNTQGIMQTGYIRTGGKLYLFNASGELDTVEDESHDITRGIDVSQFNGSIDWNKVKRESDVSWAFVRAGGRYGGPGTLFEDRMFTKNMQGSAAAHIPVGVYFFSQAITEAEAREEADYVCRKLGSYTHVALPVAIDVEITPGCRQNLVGKDRLTQVIKAFCDRVASWGYKPMIYMNTNEATNRIYYNELSSYEFWIAQYGPLNTFKHPYRIWQFTSDARVPGVDGRVDMNYYYHKLLP